MEEGRRPTRGDIRTVTGVFHSSDSRSRIASSRRASVESGAIAPRVAPRLESGDEEPQLPLFHRKGAFQEHQLFTGGLVRRRSEGAGERAELETNPGQPLQDTVVQIPRHADALFARLADLLLVLASRVQLVERGGDLPGDDLGQRDGLSRWCAEVREEHAAIHDFGPEGGARHTVALQAFEDAGMNGRACAAHQAAAGVVHQEPAGAGLPDTDERPPVQGRIGEDIERPGLVPCRGEAPLDPARFVRARLVGDLPDRKYGSAQRACISRALVSSMRPTTESGVSSSVVGHRARRSISKRSRALYRPR